MTKDTDALESCPECGGSRDACMGAMIHATNCKIYAALTTPSTTPDTIGSHFGNGGGFDPESAVAPVGYWLEPYRTMDAGGSPETAGQVGYSWLIDIARQEHENDPAALEIDLPRLTEDGTAQILYRGPKVVAACFIVRDPLNFAILFRYLAHPPHPAPVDPVAGGEALREALEPFAKAADECDGAPDEMAISDASYEEVTVGHCRQAREALAALKGPAA